jgi:hypothetical protein
MAYSLHVVAKNAVARLDATDKYNEPLTSLLWHRNERLSQQDGPYPRGRLGYIFFAARIDAHKIFTSTFASASVSGSRELCPHGPFGPSTKLGICRFAGGSIAHYCLVFMSGCAAFEPGSAAVINARHAERLENRLFLILVLGQCLCE